ncbi:PREDICTED: dual specificity protein phosphatase 10-like [Priapulus caudatus]|uniref:Dual specificity protein phosphatase 10-like n=1 Tax=Priapulus caudatus TaxID=37621 RepID=A0ABM1F7K9_PRICU|nr:PREDICTED: dual specificity protein phosphatase 10-like [Priapulus caudatus]
MITCDADIENHPASELLPHLILGNERDAADLERLRTLRVSHVLNVTSHVPFHHEQRGIAYRRLPASDSTEQNLRQYFDEAFSFIGE